MSRPLRVLLIEDSDDDALLILHELQRGGFVPSYERVETEKEMMAALSSSNWDLVISDYLMPQFNGAQALELFKKQGLEIPFIIVSGKVGEELAVQAMRSGAHDYVMKQNLTRLVPAVERELGDAEHRRQRMRINAQNERLMMAIGQCAESIVITDAEGAIQYINPAFEKITGYLSAEVLGQNPRFLKSWEQTDEFYKKMWDVLLRGEIWNGRFINKKKDGTLYTEEATISPAKDLSGNIINYVAVKRDITEEIKLEEQLRQSQKMQSIGQLVGGVAHDFNNLLQVINGCAELAQMQLAANRSPADNINEIAKAGENAKNLVQQLLTFSRQQVIDPMNLDLNKEIESSKKMLGRLIGENIQFTFSAGKGLGPIFADRGQVQQVLMNLCVNAHDAMPDGGMLTIQTKSVLIEPEDLKTRIWARPGRYVLLSVTDTGCGMKKMICEKIFDPFFTTKEVGKGTGLGLSTVYGIVKQNAGHIEVFSEPDKGTTFEIYLPVSVSNQPNGIHDLADDSQPAAGGAETILVVEDDEVVLNLATCILRDAGYAVLTASNGIEGVRVFKEHSDEIDLVMMDVMMPKMGGKEAMEKILEKYPAQRHLFVSGYSPDAKNTENNKLLLCKPYRTGDLLLKIREVLDA